MVEKNLLENGKHAKEITLYKPTSVSSIIYLSLDKLYGVACALKMNLPVHNRL